MGRGQYLTPSIDNPAGLLEEALALLTEAERIHQRLCKQLQKKLPFSRLDELGQQWLKQQLISEEEANKLSQAEICRLRSINVDEFDASALAAQPSKFSRDQKRVAVATAR